MKLTCQSRHNSNCEVDESPRCMASVKSGLCVTCSCLLSWGYLLIWMLIFQGKKKLIKEVFASGGSDMLFCLKSFLNLLDNFQINEMIVKENDKSCRFEWVAGFFGVNATERVSLERTLVPLYIPHSTAFHPLQEKWMCASINFNTRAQDLSVVTNRNWKGMLL